MQTEKWKGGEKVSKRTMKRVFSLFLICIIVICNSYVQDLVRVDAATESYIAVKYGGKKHLFPKTKQTSARVNGKKITTSMPGVIINGVNLVSPTVLKRKELGISYSYDKSKKVVTLKKDKTTIKVTMGSKIARVNGKKVRMGTAAQRMYYISKKKHYNMIPARFVIETFGMSYTWKQSGRYCAIKVKKPKETATPTIVPTATAKPTPTIVPTVVPTSTVVPTATLKVTNAPVTSSTPTATVEVASSPTVTSTPEITSTPVVVSSPSVVSSPGVTSTPSITATPSVPAEEMKAMWISYLEYGGTAKTKSKFTSMINTMFDNCVSYGMNTVIVQVRPFSDAMYKSAYFPWSRYASGTIGEDPGYDPLAIMVQLAHKKGLKIQAWVNPYRVTLGSTSVSALPDGHPAKTWRNSSSSAVKRRVLTYNGNLYYNPSSTQVRTLITDGVKEIVQNYDVDGIHFDDYFYPNLGSDYKNNFDAQEYDNYVEQCEAKGTTPKSIVSWRRSNVNSLIKKVYQAVKSVDPNCEFGISPAGNIDNLLSSCAYYVDVKTWMSKDGYVDYICPQIYWSFQNSVCPFKETVDRWASLKTNDNVKLYIGLAVYRAGSNEEKEWSTSNTVLKRQVQYGRKVEKVNGFAFYRYESFLLKRSQKEIENLLPLLTEAS